MWGHVLKNIFKSLNVLFENNVRSFLFFFFKWKLKSNFFSMFFQPTFVGKLVKWRLFHADSFPNKTLVLLGIPFNFPKNESALIQSIIGLRNPGIQEDLPSFFCLFDSQIKAATSSLSPYQLDSSFCKERDQVRFLLITHTAKDTLHSGKDSDTHWSFDRVFIHSANIYEEAPYVPGAVLRTGGATVRQILKLLD